MKTWRRESGGTRAAVPGSRPVARNALLDRINAAPWLTTVIAGAGAGKSTLLAGWAATLPVAVRELRAADAALPVLLRGIADAFDAAEISVPHAVSDALRDPTGAGDADRAVGIAGLLAAAFDHPGPAPSREPAPTPTGLVLDGVHHLDANSPGMRFVEALCRHAPGGLRLVLTSRQPLPFRVDRLRAAGLLVEVGVGDLTFAEDETYQALAAALGNAAAADALAPDLHLLTSGWPALVGQAAGWLAQQPPVDRAARLQQLGRAVGPLSEYLTTTMLTTLRAEDRSLIQQLAHLTAVDSAIADELDLSEQLVAIPPFVEEVAGWYAVHYAIRDTVIEHLPLPDQERVRLLRAAVSAYARRGQVESALAAARALGDPATVAALLAGHGAALIAAGRAADVVEEAAKIVGSARTPEIDLVEGEARHLCGDHAGALRCFSRLDGAGGALTAAVAHRVGNLHHSAGDLGAAAAAYRRGMLGAESTADEAILLARLSGIEWLRGDDARCADYAERSLRAAQRSGDQRALARAHDVVAAAAERAGDWERNAEHMRQAYAAATRAGDLNAQLRTRIGSSQRKLERARFADALLELDDALRLVEAIGAPGRRAVVLINRGWAFRGLGRLDEAIAEMEAARRIWRAAGSAHEAYALSGLGAVYLMRGDLATADAVLSEAAATAERTDNAQSWSALATWCRVRYATDPAGAKRMAERALATNTGLWRVWALLSAGWIALHDDEPDVAEHYADRAAEVTARRSDLTALAEERELRAFLVTDPSRRLRWLQEAQLLHTRIGNALFVVRTLAAQAIVAGDAGALTAAEARLRAVGIRPDVARAAGPFRAAGIFSGVPKAAPSAALRTGLDRLRQGDLDGAATLLAEAVERCPGEDGGHVACVEAMRALAALAQTQGFTDAALRWHLRVLEHAPDDEAGHLGAVHALVRGGRQEEAHRRYRGYADRMRSRGAEPAPFPL